MLKIFATTCLSLLRSFGEILLQLLIFGVFALFILGVSKTAPYSIYLIGIALGYIFSNIIFDYNIDKLKDDKHINTTKLYLFYYLRNAFKLFFVSLLPLVLVQILLNYSNDLNISSEVASLELFLSQIGRYCVNNNIPEILLFTIVILLILGPYIYYKYNKTKLIYTKALKSIYILNVLTFLFGFSFFGSIFTVGIEENWIFNKRRDVEFYYNPIMRQQAQEYWLIDQISINQDLKKELTRIIHTIIITAASYTYIDRSLLSKQKIKLLKIIESDNRNSDRVRDVTIKLLKIAFSKTKTKSEIIVLEVDEKLKENLDSYRSFELKNIFHSNYSIEEINKKLTIIKETKKKIKEKNTAAKKSLINALSSMISALSPDISDKIISDVVNEAISNITEPNLEFVISKSKSKMSAVVLSTFLITHEPQILMPKRNKPFVASYVKKLRSITKEFIQENEKLARKEVSAEASYKKALEKINFEMRIKELKSIKRYRVPRVR